MKPWTNECKRISWRDNGRETREKREEWPDQCQSSFRGCVLDWFAYWLIEWFLFPPNNSSLTLGLLITQCVVKVPSVDTNGQPAFILLLCSALFCSSLLFSSLLFSSLPFSSLLFSSLLFSSLLFSSLPFSSLFFSSLLFSSILFFSLLFSSLPFSSLLVSSLLFSSLLFSLSTIFCNFQDLPTKLTTFFNEFQPPS